MPKGYLSVEVFYRPEKDGLQSPLHRLLNWSGAMTAQSAWEIRQAVEEALRRFDLGTFATPSQGEEKALIELGKQRTATNG